ncbi:MAG: SPOR domain-containing protein [Myxococcales bacterium]|nr:MAG: SPOR domain-containing protein [Myxococcales bacterium]
MRDNPRPGAKLAFSLDGRQTALLFIGGVIVLAIVFSLGVTLGKRLTLVVEQPKTENVLQTVDQQAEIYKRQAEALAQAQQAAEPAQQQIPPPVPSEAKPASSAPSAAAEAKPAPAPPPPPAPPPSAAMEAAARTQEPTEEAAETTPQKDGKPVPPPPAVTTGSNPTPEAGEKSTAPPEPSPAPAAQEGQAQTPAPEGKFYTLQIASLPSRDQAENFAKKYKPFDSRKPFISSAEVPGKGVWYRVKVGKFETKEQALAYQSIFESKTKIPTILAFE